MKNNVKKIVLCTFLTLSSAISIVCAPLEPLIKYPTQQELEEVEKLLSTLSPEELDELTKLGEELIKTAEAEGRPLFGPAPEELAKPLPAPAPVKPMPVKPTAAEVRESSIPKKQLSDLQKMLSDLVDALSTIRQKAASDEKLILILEPIATKLNSIAYYLRTIAYSKQTARLTEKEFTPLKDTITKFSINVEMINDMLIVDDTAASLTKPNNMQKAATLQQAQATLTRFADVITTACSQQHLLEDLEVFMKKYEPEALEVRKKQEAQEKEAISYTKKIPSTNTGAINPQLPAAPAPENPVSRGSQGATGVRFGQPGSGGNPLSVKTAKPMQQSGSGGSSNNGGSQGDQKSAATKKAGDDKKDKDDKKKDELQDAPLTINDQTQEIKTRLVGLNNRVIAGKSQSDAFFTYLYESPDEVSQAEQVRIYQPLGELYYETFRIKKSLEKWAETIGKTSEYREARAYQDSMQKVADSMLTDFKGLINRIDTVLTDPNKSKRIQAHEEELKDLRKIAKDITTIRIRPK